MMMLADMETAISPELRKSIDEIKAELTWKELIQAAEDRVNECQIQIQRLTKSIAFFKKQEDAKIPFPRKAKKKQQDKADAQQ